MKSYSINVHYDVVIPVEVTAQNEEDALSMAESFAESIDLTSFDDWKEYGISIADTNSCITDIK